MILDSGARKTFESGAVRDISENKGRCDLLPLDIASEWLANDMVLENIYMFQESGDTDYLYEALTVYAKRCFCTPITTLLEVSKHFEEGAIKYNENNWRKGINAKNYVDSAVRHYLKWLRDDDDESHDKAVAWNIMCCIYTCKHYPNLNDYRKEGAEE